jgi:hypothetical protein
LFKGEKRKLWRTGWEGEEDDEEKKKQQNLKEEKKRNE